jgi:hypothetical protein
MYNLLTQVDNEIDGMKVLKLIQQLSFPGLSPPHGHFLCAFQDAVETGLLSQYSLNSLPTHPMILNPIHDPS